MEYAWIYSIWMVMFGSSLTYPIFLGRMLLSATLKKMDECFQGVDDDFHIFQDPNNSFFKKNSFGVCYTMYLHIYIYIIIYIYTVSSSWHVPIFFGRDSEKHWLLRYPTCSSIWAIPRWSCWRGARKRS